MNVILSAIILISDDTVHRRYSAQRDWEMFERLVTSYLSTILCHHQATSANIFIFHELAASLCSSMLSIQPVLFHCGEMQ